MPIGSLIKVGDASWEAPADSLAGVPLNGVESTVALAQVGLTVAPPRRPSATSRPTPTAAASSNTADSRHRSCQRGGVAAAGVRGRKSPGESSFQLASVNPARRAGFMLIGGPAPGMPRGAGRYGSPLPEFPAKRYRDQRSIPLV